MPETSALARLRQTLAKVRSGVDDELAEAAASRDEVLSRYGTVFSTEGVDTLTAEDFLGFLQFKNNRHWKGIHRQGAQIVSDMDALRSALHLLLDESIPLETRLRKLRPMSGEPMIKGLARSVLTPILLIAYPEKYGVVNQVAESGMKELGIWPEFDRGTDFAAKYVAINRLLNQVAADLGIDLWTLDSLWWGLDGGEIGDTAASHSR